MADPLRKSNVRRITRPERAVEIAKVRRWLSPTNQKRWTGRPEK